MNDRLVTEIKRALAELTDAAPPTRPLDDLLASRSGPPAPRHPRRVTFAAVALSLAVAVAGLVFVRTHVDRDRRGDDTPTTTLPVNTTPATTAAPTATTTPAPATTATPRTTVEPATTAPAPDLAGPADAALATGFEPASITWISLRQGWLLGHAPCTAGTCLSLARTRDGGQTWHGVPAPATTATSVRFADDHDGWIFGADLYATHDGGSTWTKVDGLVDVTNLEVANGRAWAEAAWSVSPDNKVVYTSLVTSDEWHQIAAMPVSTPIAMHGGAGYVGGPDGGLFVVTATGFDVRTDPCGFETDIGAIAAVDDQTVAVVCGSDVGGGSETKRLYVSRDGGHFFTVVANSEAPRPGIAASAAAASADTFVIAATSGASYLYRTTDDGATWNTVFQDGSGGAPIADLGFTDATHGVAVLGTEPSVLLTTSDAGATWTKAAVHD